MERAADARPDLGSAASMRSPTVRCRLATAVFATTVALSVPAGAAETGFDRLVAAYPDALAGHDATSLLWKDGTRMPLAGSAKSFDERLKNASLADQMSLAYPAGPLAAPPGPGSDPGRFRNLAFFDKMYGDCNAAGFAKRLVPVRWLPKSWGKTLRVSPVNGVAAALEAVSREIEALPGDVRQYAFPSAGTFNCRVVKDTGVRSAHAYGIAIDLNTAHADYWLWAKGGKAHPVYRNRMPQAIVDVFERHGFIWGGKWSHFDTMHFEYRPELLPPAKR